MLLPIVQFSWHEFDLRDAWAPTVRELLVPSPRPPMVVGAAAEDSNGPPPPYVLRAGSARRALVVYPEWLSRQAERLGFGMDRPVEADFLDQVSVGQRTVGAEEPAPAVAAEMRTAGQWMAVVVTNLKDLKPVGLFLPGWVRERLAGSHFVIQEGSWMRAAVERSTENDDLPEAFRTIEKAEKPFHSEQINLIPMNPLMCPGDSTSGPHPLDGPPPCLAHAGSNITRRTFAVRRY